MKTRTAALAALALTIAAGVVACKPGDVGSLPQDKNKPNIIFVLTDDLAMNLVQYMPHVQALAKAGTSFANYTVTDSLCCPSRSSILTGKYPHNTGVYTNGGKDGGFNVFHDRGEEKSTFGTDLQQAGYRTAFMGKYLNGYLPKDNYVPPGWDEWDVAGNGYPNYNYTLSENNKLVKYGNQPADYLTDVIGGKAAAFAGKGGKPFFVELATFTPHAPYTPAPQDKDKFPGLKAPRGPAYDKLPANASKWLASNTPLTDQEKTQIDTAFRKRVQAVQSVDRMIGNLQDTLTKAGIADNTVIVFSSDNGYHLGDDRLNPGQPTADDTDVNVPLIAAGPGIKAGQVVKQPAQNIDLRATFGAIGKATVPTDVDGHSLLPLLGGTVPSGWRSTALVEHHGPDNDPKDPDHPAPKSGNPTTYEAIRTTSYTYVEYANGEREYYDRINDPNMLNNSFKTLDQARVTELHNAVQALKTCKGQSSCK